MKYKMMVVDLDDSLLGNDLTISEANQKALFEAVAQDVLITIATGRMFVSALPYVKQLELNIPIITYQGALIKNALTNEVLLHRPISKVHAERIIEEAKSKGIYLQLYLDDHYYFEQECEKSELYRRLSGIKGCEAGPLEGCLHQEPTKMLMIDDPPRIREMKRHFDNVFQDEIQVTISKPNYLEFTHRDATKGKAVEYLANMFSVQREEIIAIGDSYNDISMIEYAGLGVAMGNSPLEIQQAADYVTRSNEEEGIAHIIERFILEGRLDT